MTFIIIQDQSKKKNCYFFVLFSVCLCCFILFLLVKDYCPFFFYCLYRMNLYNVIYSTLYISYDNNYGIMRWFVHYLPFSKQLSKFVTLLLGEDLHLAEKGAQETSSVVVETVQKVSKNRAGQGVVLPLFKSDASKVTCKGMGLKKAYLQKQNMFTVSCADAGLSTHYLIPSTFVRFERSH